MDVPTFAAIVVTRTPPPSPGQEIDELDSSPPTHPTHAFVTKPVKRKSAAAKPKAPVETEPAPAQPNATVKRPKKKAVRKASAHASPPPKTTSAATAAAAGGAGAAQAKGKKRKSDSGEEGPIAGPSKLPKKLAKAEGPEPPKHDQRDVSPELFAPDSSASSIGLPLAQVLPPRAPSPPSDSETSTMTTTDRAPLSLVNNDNNGSDVEAKPVPRNAAAQRRHAEVRATDAQLTSHSRTASSNTSSNFTFPRPESPTARHQRLPLSSSHPQQSQQQPSPSPHQSSSASRAAFIPLSPSGFSGALHTWMSKTNAERDSAIEQANKLEKVVQERDKVIGSLDSELKSVKEDRAVLKENIDRLQVELGDAKERDAKAWRREDALREVRKGLLDQLKEARELLRAEQEKGRTMKENEDDADE
ncbi:hypothetical protein RQP46_006454 [Phenoliferia psychrophenolica]